MEEKKTGRCLYFDILNVAACIAVVIAHHHGHAHAFDNSRGWIFSIATECFVFWSVPIFLMVSGATLMGFHNKYSLKTYFSKRVIRTVIPWILWSGILLVWKVKTGQMTLEGSGFAYYYDLIINNKVESIYWYFRTMFLCYLAIPILTWLTPHRKALWYGVAVIFILSVLQPLVGANLPISDSAITQLRNSLIVFIMLGYLLSTASLTRGQRIALYLAAVGAIICRFSITYVLSVANGASSVVARSAKMCNSIVVASAIFVFCKERDWEEILPDRVQKLIHALASCSFGVYLMHKVVIYYELQIFDLTNKSLLFKTLCIPLTYLVSVIFIWCLKKIPFLGKYIC